MGEVNKKDKKITLDHRYRIIVFFNSDLEAPSTLKTIHNGTTSPLAHVAPLVELTIPEEEPYERIPAECFTMSFDCNTSPSHMCCAYHQ